MIVVAYDNINLRSIGSILRKKRPLVLQVLVMCLYFFIPIVNYSLVININFKHLFKEIVFTKVKSRILR